MVSVNNAVGAGLIQLQAMRELTKNELAGLGATDPLYRGWITPTVEFPEPRLKNLKPASLLP